MFTVEDYIEFLTGFKGSADIKLDKSDYALMFSFAKQIARSIPFTDKQCELAKTKITYYKDELIKNDYEVNDLTQLRMPLRSIDRSRWVRIVEKINDPKLTIEDNGPWIALRFIFQKKLIGGIERIQSSLDEKIYDKEKKIHYFSLNENSVYEILSSFNEQNNFEVDQQLTDYYEKILKMKNDKEQYVPGIYNFKLKNLSLKGVEYAVSTIGEPDINNLCYYYDQRERLGLEHFDEEDIYQSVKSLTPLTKKIVNRKQDNILVNKKEYTRENLVESVLELYRFPLLIILNDETCHDELLQFYKAFNGIIPDESCSVLFRLDNTGEGKYFNQAVKQYNLNNPVDNNTKIVYINNKLPKPLLKTSWAPISAITNYSGKTYGSDKLEAYLNDIDLVIHYDDDVSPWKRRLIEKI